MIYGAMSYVREHANTFLKPIIIHRLVDVASQQSLASLDEFNPIPWEQVHIDNGVCTASQSMSSIDFREAILPQEICPG